MNTKRCNDYYFIKQRGISKLTQIKEIYFAHQYFIAELAYLKRDTKSIKSYIEENVSSIIFHINR